jgi:Zn finger protein HypA/HybF involved in hydrogenase expression
MFQIETDGDEFECVECGRIIKVGFAQEAPRPITCEECGTEYSVSKGNGNGLSVTMADAAPEGFNDLDEEDEN